MLVIIPHVSFNLLGDGLRCLKIRVVCDVKFCPREGLVSHGLLSYL